jgi:RimJ/RimL family protein N-acetyltransferase
MWAAMTESADALRRTMSWWRDDQTRHDMAAWIAFAGSARADGTLYAFSIFDAAGRYLGACSLEAVSPTTRSANLSYWVRTSATGQGVARTCARALAEFGCTALGLRRVEIGVVTTNPASVAAARASGAHYEGRLRNKTVWEGLSYDLEVFSFVPADFG